MNKKCLACNRPLVGQQRKWCSSTCAQRARFNQQTDKAIDARKWVPQSSCVQCGASTEHRGPQAKYCSIRCKLDSDHERQTNKFRERRAAQGKSIPGQLIVCKHPNCQVSFVKKHAQLFCSKECAIDYGWRIKSPNGFGDRCAVYFHQCPDCQSFVCRKAPGAVHQRCSSCKVVRNREINARKNHKRRTAGRIEVGIRDLAKRDGERCYLCHRKLNLTLPGTAKWGATIDHILPVSFGGTNEANNLALAHRHCNVARGNRQPAQMLLTA